MIWWTENPNSSDWKSKFTTCQKMKYRSVSNNELNFFTNMTRSIQLDFHFLSFMNLSDSVSRSWMFEIMHYRDRTVLKSCISIQFLDRRLFRSCSFEIVYFWDRMHILQIMHYRDRTVLKSCISIQFLNRTFSRLWIFEKINFRNLTFLGSFILEDHSEMWSYIIKIDVSIFLPNFMFFGWNLLCRSKRKNLVINFSICPDLALSLILVWVWSIYHFDEQEIRTVWLWNWASWFWLIT